MIGGQLPSRVNQDFDALTRSKEEQDKQRHSNDDESRYNEWQAPVVVPRFAQECTSNQWSKDVTNICMRVPQSVDQSTPVMQPHIFKCGHHITAALWRFC